MLLQSISNQAAATKQVQTYKDSVLFDIINACVELRVHTFPKVRVFRRIVSVNDKLLGQVWRTIASLFPVGGGDDLSNSPAGVYGSSAQSPSPNVPDGATTSRPSGLSALLKFGFGTTYLHFPRLD